MQRHLLIGSGLGLLALGAALGTDEDRPDRFRQLHDLLPTPNAQRAASGAPGHQYWQQQVDYQIDVTLDEANHRIVGSERIAYQNNSPDTLTYLWVQLDPNLLAPDSHAVLTSLAPELEEMSFGQLESMLVRQAFDGGCKITRVDDLAGQGLDHTITDTMMRVDLPAPLLSGQSYHFTIDWSYEVNDAKKIRARTGFEHFEKDGNDLYEIAQWFPRMCAYTDYAGWQNKQFLGSGEFTLEFGDYTVSITAPDDHVVASTGVLQNPDEVLKPEWKQRLQDAESAVEAQFIVTPAEALANESNESSGTKTWTFFAKNVRDFAWASSRKFIWDAVLHPVEGGEPVWAMSYYPNEGEPLWSRYSTHSIQHTLDVYSKHTFPYPYPVAISVNGPIGGMEYPMICFNGPRPEEDGTYSKRTKYGLISVIIHEVGHNWFPMIVNSDERQWTWMDEGLNTFCQFLAEQEWEEDYPSRRGEARNIVSYMASENQVPIMTNSESILQFGNNAYGKPATALNVLRETVMGRELFDFAFKEYSNRWRFRRPEPADLFRTLEDASAVDLDWFWRSWFFTTDAVDHSVNSIQLYHLDTQDPEREKAEQREARDQEPSSPTIDRNQDITRRSDHFKDLLDFYNEYDPLAVTEKDRKSYAKLLEDLDDDERELLELKTNFHVIEIEDHGGIPMPIILKLTWRTSGTEIRRIPAQVWRNNAPLIRVLVMHESDTLARVELDPLLETADVERANNVWPREIEELKIKLTDRPDRKNPMQAAAAAARGDDDEDSSSEDDSDG